MLTEAADPSGDPSLALRLAAVAAERNLPMSRDALNLLGRKAPEPPEPWPDDLRGLLVRVLASGPPAIAALEALDRRHLIERYLPEWAAVRNKPQRNPYHRFTVDRHLLEATANAATLAHRVERVDLLLLGTLLHDIGKGFPGDHTEVGMVVAAEIGARLGLPPDDVETLVTMVRLHLLLPDVATRRDLDDPATAERVAARSATVRPSTAPPRPRRGRQHRHRTVGVGAVEGRTGGRPRRAHGTSLGRRAGRPADPLGHRRAADDHGHRPRPRCPRSPSRTRSSPWWLPTGRVCWRR